MRWNITFILKFFNSLILFAPMKGFLVKKCCAGMKWWWGGDVSQGITDLSKDCAPSSLSSMKTFQIYLATAVVRIYIGFLEISGCLGGDFGGDSLALAGNAFRGSVSAGISG